MAKELSGSDVDGKRTTVRGILIDPERRVFHFVDVPAQRKNLPGGYRGYDHIAPDVLIGFVGSSEVEKSELFNDEVMLLSIGGMGEPWRLGNDGPHKGRGLLLQYKADLDAYSDTHLTLEKVGDLIKFGSGG